MRIPTTSAGMAIGSFRRHGGFLSAAGSSVPAFLPTEHRFAFPSRNGLSSVRLWASLSPGDNSNEIATIIDKDSSQAYASTYHAPVMWKECVDALLQKEDDDSTNPKAKNRLKRRKYAQQSTNRARRNKDETDSESHRQQQEQQPNRNRIFVDGTLGGGGHTEALLQACQPGDVVYGCDVDAEALQTAQQRLERYLNKNSDNDTDNKNSQLPQFVPVQSNFADLLEHLPEDIIGRVDGMLLDLGVSSHQIDTPERGFAFMHDGPLDMRMTGSTNNGNNGITAAEVCNTLDSDSLTDVLRQYGQEPRARKIAESLVQHRPLSSTQDLTAAVAAVVPEKARHKRNGRTATLARVFQALRMTVNAETDVLHRVLETVAPALLRSGSGRLVVLSYHSLEDGAVKRMMRDGSVHKANAKQNSRSNNRDLYGRDTSIKPFRPLRRQTASETEIDQNSRARSATLRIAERTQMRVDENE